MFLLVFCSCICEEAQIKSYLVLLYCRESRHLHRSHSVAHAKTIRMMNSPTGTRKMCNFSWNVSLMAFFFTAERRLKSSVTEDFWHFLTWFYSNRRTALIQRGNFLPKKRFTDQFRIAVVLSFLFLHPQSSRRVFKMQMWTLQTHQLWCPGLLGWLRRNKRLILTSLPVSRGRGFSGWLTTVGSQGAQKWSC